jgi:hypothetical protein
LIDAEFPAAATGGSADAAAEGRAAAAEAADEVSVVYYRSGYSPADFTSEPCWAAKLLAERSVAVKCPPILYHLAGTKKVQQALAGKGQVERFLPAPAAAAVRACFAGLWSLDAAERDAEAVSDPCGCCCCAAASFLRRSEQRPSVHHDAQAQAAFLSTLTHFSLVSLHAPLCLPPHRKHPLQAAAIADAHAHPERYVVKPQREGGGNNLFGPAVRVALAGIANSSAASAATPAKAADAGARVAEQAPSVALIGAASPAIDGIATGANASAAASSGSSAAVPDAPMGEAELAAHILMERVSAPVTPALLCRLGAVVAAPAVCELGIYGVFLGNGRGAPIRNACVGHLLRTKAEGTDEGGVAAGYAVLDSPFLVD